MLDVSKLNKDRFEELCYQLAYQEFSNLGAFTPINGKGGDGGVEFYLTLKNGDIRGWQCKLFNSIGSSQKKKIVDSMEVSKKNHPNLKKRFLCVPVNITHPIVQKNGQIRTGERDWLSKFKEKNEGIEVEERFYSRLNTLLIKYSNIDNAFFNSDPVKRKEGLINTVEQNKNNTLKTEQLAIDKQNEVDSIFINGKIDDIQRAKEKYMQYNIAKFRFIECPPIIEDINHIENDINIKNLNSHNFPNFPKDFQSIVSNYFSTYKPRNTERHPAFYAVLNEIGKQIGGILSIGINGKFTLPCNHNIYLLTINE